MARQLIDAALRTEIESIFETAIELAPADREYWLAERCGTDPRLRAEVDALLAAHARKHNFAMADSLFGVALASQRRYVADTHFDIRAIFGPMSERYRLEGNQVEAARYARLAHPR
jgi:hypothetical protein